MFGALLLTSALGCGGSEQGPDDETSPYLHSGDATVGAHSDAGAKSDAKVLPSNGGSDAASYGQNEGPNGTCDSLLINAAPNAPEVLIVLDRSGSMAGNNATKTNRWTPSASVIKSLTSQLDQTMHFGLMLFPDPAAPINITGVSPMCAVGKLSVPVGVGTSGAIATAIDLAAPSSTSQTPTAATLAAALDAIDQPSACSDTCTPPRKYVLLVTDGAPNCGDGKSSKTLQSDINACNTGIDALKSADVTTYVIGYDTTDASTAAIMNGFASHGGTDHQLPVEDEASLLSTLTKIAGELVACDYTLSTEVEDPSYVRVTIDDKQVGLGDGWTLKDDKKTILLNKACDTLRDAKPHSLKITLECEQVVVI